MYIVIVVMELIKTESTPVEASWTALGNSDCKYNVPLVQGIQNILLRWFSGKLADRTDARSSNLASKLPE